MTGAGIQFRMDTRPIAKAIDAAPSATYYWLRSYLRGAFIGHRDAWLQGKNTRFGRGGENSRAIRVFRIDEAPAGAPQDNWVVYDVRPRDKRVRDASQARVALGQLQGAAHAGSIVLRVHQFGEDLHSAGKLLSIPIRTRPATPKAWRAKNPGKDLIARAAKNNPNTVLLYEVTRTRGRGRPRKDGTSSAKLVERWRLRFLLRRHIDMRPTLNFYETWQAGAAERDRQFRFVADRILKDMAHGVTA